MIAVIVAEDHGVEVLDPQAPKGLDLPRIEDDADFVRAQAVRTLCAMRVNRSVDDLPVGASAPESVAPPTFAPQPPQSGASTLGAPSRTLSPREGAGVMLGRFDRRSMKRRSIRSFQRQTQSPSVVRPCFSATAR